MRLCPGGGRRGCWQIQAAGWRRARESERGERGGAGSSRGECQGSRGLDLLAVMDGSGRRRRREASQKGFLLALEWLKGNLELTPVGLEDGGQKTAYAKHGRKRRKKAKVAGDVSVPKNAVRTADVEKASLCGNKDTQLSERRTPKRRFFSCTRCGKVVTTRREFEQHSAICKVEPKWTGTEKVFCSVCRADRDDGGEMIECGKCHNWEHTSCHHVEDPTVEWLCGTCSEVSKPIQDSVAETEFEDLTICEGCLEGDDDAKLFLCDSCNRGYHTYCMLEGQSLPLLDNDQWFCSPSCQQNIKLFEQTLYSEVNKHNKVLASVETMPRSDGKREIVERSKSVCLEALTPRSPRYLRNGAEKMLLNAFGGNADGSGMDMRYIVASLRSGIDGPWDNSLHRTIVLHRSGHVDSVGTFRLLGDNAAAELIFAITSPTKRQSGLFRTIHDVLVRSLVGHGVQHFVIHATKSSEQHFMKYNRTTRQKLSQDIPLKYGPLDRHDPVHRRLLPRLLEMRSKMLITALPSLSEELDRR